MPEIAIAEPRTPADSHPGPDAVTLGVVRPDGTPTEPACLDGRYLPTEVTGGFTGRVIGMYASSGAVHFDWFDYEPVEATADDDTTMWDSEQVRRLHDMPMDAF